MQMMSKRPHNKYESSKGSSVGELVVSSFWVCTVRRIIIRDVKPLLPQDAENLTELLILLTIVEVCSERTVESLRTLLVLDGHSLFGVASKARELLLLYNFRRFEVEEAPSVRFSLSGRELDEWISMPSLDLM